MPELSPDDGATEAVSASDPRGTYDVEVTSGVAVVARTKSEAERRHGRKIRGGDRAQIRLNDPDESVWVQAVNGTLRYEVEKSGFFMELFSRPTTQTEDERVERESDYDTAYADNVAPGPPPTTVVDYTNTTGGEVYVSHASVIQDNVSYDFTDRLQISARILDNGFYIYERYEQGAGVIQFDPYVRLEPGQSLEAEVWESPGDTDSDTPTYKAQIMVLVPPENPDYTGDGAI